MYNRDGKEYSPVDQQEWLEKSPASSRHGFLTSWDGKEQFLLPSHLAYVTSYGVNSVSSTQPARLFITGHQGLFSPREALTLDGVIFEETSCHPDQPEEIFIHISEMVFTVELGARREAPPPG